MRGKGRGWRSLVSPRDSRAKTSRISLLSSSPERTMGPPLYLLSGKFVHSNYQGLSHSRRYRYRSVSGLRPAPRGPGERRTRRRQRFNNSPVRPSRPPRSFRCNSFRTSILFYLPAPRSPVYLFPRVFGGIILMQNTVSPAGETTLTSDSALTRTSPESFHRNFVSPGRYQSGPVM